MSHAKYRRRRLLVDRRTQLRTAFIAGGSLVVYSVVLGLLIFYPLQLELTRDASPEMQVMAADQILELHRRVWPAIIAVAILVGFQSVIMSHRTLGPLYRLKIAFAALQAGDLGHRVKLREHDQFKELAEAFNLLAESLQQAETRRGHPGSDGPQPVHARAALQESPELADAVAVSYGSSVSSPASRRPSA